MTKKRKNKKDNFLKEYLPYGIGLIIFLYLVDYFK
jgi:hypothetical protein